MGDYSITLTAGEICDAMLGVFFRRVEAQADQLKLRQQGLSDNPQLDVKVYRLQLLERRLEKAANGEPA